MALFANLTPLRTTAQSPFIGDPATGLVHRLECPARPQHGDNFVSRQAALAHGYTYCACAKPAAVAPADRIRALLETTLTHR